MKQQKINEHLIKRIKDLCEKVGRIEDNMLSHVVVCAECGVLIKEGRAHKVTVTANHEFAGPKFHLFYCKAHTKKYDTVLQTYDGDKYLKTNVAVTENGKIIN